MKKNKIFAIAMVMVMMFALAACGNKGENTNNVEDIETSVIEESTVGENTLETEEDMDEAIDANEGETKEEIEVVYEERENHYLMISNNMYGDKYVDGERIKEGKGYTNPIWQDITINDEIKLYDVMKYEVGYTKSGINAILIEAYGEWTYIDVYDNETAYAVRTDELDKAMAVAIENNSTRPEKESASEKNEENKNTNETTYSVVEMSATKYAKQSVNIRKGPGTDYEKIGSLTMNQKVTVTGQADNGWYRISYNGGDAYVSNKYLVDNKVEITTNNGGNSNNGEENNNGSNDTTNNSNTDNGGGNNTPTPEPTPTTPTIDYSASDVVAVIESTLRGAGFSKTTDVMTAEEIAMFGPTAGAGWGEEKVSLSNAQYIANGLVDYMNSSGYNAFYIEVLGMSDGVVTIRFYRCTF